MRLFLHRRMSRDLVCRWGVFVLATGVLSGCASYSPAPIESTTDTGWYSERRLTDAALRQFADSLSPDVALSSWPPSSWSQDDLALAAFYFSPDLSLSIAEGETVRASVKTAGQRPNPDVSGSIGRNTTSAIPSPWMLSSLLEFTLETSGKRSIRKKQATANVEAAQFRILSKAWEIRTGVQTAMAELDWAQRRESVLLDKQALVESLKNKVDQRMAAGAISESDRRLIQTSYLMSDLDLVEAVITTSMARLRLAEAIGIPVEALSDVSLEFTSYPGNRTEPDRDATRRTALLNRADLLEELTTYQVRELELQAEIKNQYPDLRLGPGYEYDQGDNKWSLGIGASLPALNRNRGPIAEANAARSEQRVRFEALQGAILQEVDQSIAQVHGAGDVLTHTDSLLQVSTSHVDHVRSSWQAGAVPETDFLLARLDAADVELRQLDALLEVRRAAILLEHTIQGPLSFRPPRP